MPDKEDLSLRKQLVALLKGGQAHVSLADAVANFPADRVRERPDRVPYSAWQLVEHMRIALHDLLGFCTDSHYVELDWPDAYWPKQTGPENGESWDGAVKAIHEDLKQFEDLVNSPQSNLYAAIPWGKRGETLLREVLLAADHTSYHIGELILLRRLLGLWKS